MNDNGRTANTSCHRPLPARLRFCAVVVVLAFIVAPAHAQDFTWVGGHSLYWGDHQNWFHPKLSGQVPGLTAPGANASIPSASGLVTLDAGGGNNIVLGTLQTGTGVRFSGVNVSLAGADVRDIEIGSNAMLSCPGQVTLSGTTVWGLGGFAGGGEVLNLDTISMATQNQGRSISTPLRNVGTVNHGNNFFINAGGSVLNQGQWNLFGPVTAFTPSPGAGPFNNSGNLNSSSSATVNCVFNNEPSGSVSVTAGELAFKGSGSHKGQFQLSNNATLRYLLDNAGETITIDDGATFTGVGNVRINSAGISIPLGASVTANMAPASTNGFYFVAFDPVTIHGVLNNTGKMSWGAGIITGEGEIQNAGTLHLNGGQLRLPLVNASGGSVIQTANFFGQNSTINLEEGSTWEMYGGNLLHVSGNTNNTLLNSGLFKRTGADGTSLQVGIYTVLLDGTFEVTGPGNLYFSGSGEFNGAGTFDVKDRICTLDSGIYVVNGTPVVQSEPDGVGRFVLNTNATARTANGGTLTNLVQGASPLSQFYLYGKVVSAGAGPESGAIVNKARMNIFGVIGSPTEFGKVVNEMELSISATTVYGELANLGFIFESGIATLQGGTFNNNGEWILQGATINGVGPSARFNNLQSGTLKAISGTPTIGGTAVLNNEGTVYAINGTTLILHNVQQVNGNQLQGGRWVVEDGGNINFVGANIQVIGAGTVLGFNGGTISGVNPLVIMPGAEIIDASQLGVPSMQNSGTINVLPGGSVNVGGPFMNQGGTVNLEGDSNLNVEEPLNNEVDNGILGEIDEVFVRSLAGGVLEPMITTPALNNNAILRPGGPSAPGPFNLTGTLNQLSNGRIHIELGGTIPVDEHDQMRIYNGNANLAGKLVIELLGKYAPESGQAFDVLTVTNGSISGTFNTIQSPTGHVFIASYLRDRVVLIYQGEAVPGDITGDGSVNVNDLLAVINAWGSCPAPPQPCPADIAPPPDGDGVVNVNDLLTVINNWG